MCNLIYLILRITVSQLRKFLFFKCIHSIICYAHRLEKAESKTCERDNGLIIVMHNKLIKIMCYIWSLHLSIIENACVNAIE